MATTFIFQTEIQARPKYNLFCYPLPSHNCILLLDT